MGIVKKEKVNNALVGKATFVQKKSTIKTADSASEKSESDYVESDDGKKNKKTKKSPSPKKEPEFKPLTPKRV